jgi:hypothetical protein
MEDVSDRYGLLGKKVRTVAALGGELVAFTYEGGFAVADGEKIELYPEPTFQTIAGGGKRLAALGAEGVKVFDPVAKQLSLYPLADARHATFDTSGRLVVATTRRIFMEQSGMLVPRHDEDADIDGLVTSGARVWFAAGGELAVIDVAGVMRSRGAGIPRGAKLFPAEGGDVWILADGDLRRFGVDEGSDVKERSWKETIEPVFQRACAQCHLPGGTAGFDLSSYRTWATHRESIRDRVLVRQQMPPAGNELTEADRAAIAKWIEAAP